MAQTILQRIAMNTGDPEELVTYRVLYANAGAKKRKSFSDGFLRLKPATGSSYTVSLVSEDGNDLRKSIEKNTKAFKEGAEVTFGAFLVQIEDLISSAAPVANQPVATISPTALTLPKGGFTAPKLHYLVSNVQNNAVVRPMSRFVVPSLKAPVQKPVCVAPKEHKNISPVIEDQMPTEAEDTFWDEEITQNQPTSQSLSISAARNIDTFGKNTAAASAPATAPLYHSTSSALHSKPLFKPMMSSTGYKIELDPSLVRVMRPHQITGAEFLIARLQNNSTTDVCSNTFSSNDDSVGTDGKPDFSEFDLEVGEENVCTGAILADEVSGIFIFFILFHLCYSVSTLASVSQRLYIVDILPYLKCSRWQMGVGKTLTAIATVWAFVRTKTQRKCLIITPSSLVDNWIKEIKHWLGKSYCAFANV